MIATKQLIFVVGLMFVLVGAFSALVMLGADKADEEADALWTEEGLEQAPSEKKYIAFSNTKVEVAPVVCDTMKGHDRCLAGAVVAGFPKGGTAQLNAALGACHPQVESSGEELEMKSKSAHDVFRNLVKVTEADEKMAIGSSPIMAYMKVAELEATKKLIPHLKLIYLLREPASRDYSHFKMFIRHHSFSVPFPARCFNNTSECLFNLVMENVVLSSDVWSSCANATYAQREILAQKEEIARGRKSDGVKIYDDGEWDEMLHWDDIAQQEVWEECVVSNPTNDWAEGAMHSVLISDYLGPLKKTIDVFGEENVRWYQSEKFFAYEEEVVVDMVTFLGLDPYEGLHKCFKETGNYKADVEDKLFAKANIEIVPMSPRLKSLLVALHRGPVAQLELELDHQFHWFD